MFNTKYNLFARYTKMHSEPSSEPSSEETPTTPTASNTSNTSSPSSASSTFHFPVETEKEYNERFAHVHELDVKKQMEYADEICTQSCQDLQFSYSQLVEAEKNPQYHLWNISSVGNVARMVVMGPEKHRQRWKCILDGFGKRRTNIERKQRIVNGITKWGSFFVPVCLAVYFECPFLIPVVWYLHNKYILNNKKIIQME
jgi:hypothetical protein